MRDFTDQSGARVTPLAEGGMVTIRADLAQDAIRAALAAANLPLPGPLQIAGGAEGQVAWMSPDELLVLCAPEDVAERMATLASALEGHHHLLVDIGSARARFAVTGPGARAALAKLCPIDIARLAPGMFRRTRLAQVSAALWMTDADAFEVVCFRSVAAYAHEALATAARHVEDIRLP